MKKLFSTILTLAILFTSVVMSVNANEVDLHLTEFTEGFLPEGIIMPRNGVLELTGDRLDEYVRLSSIEDSENITKIIVSYIPSTVSNSKFESTDPRFSSFEVRNVRPVTNP